MIDNMEEVENIPIRVNFNWNDKILGHPLIKIRDFLNTRKFKNISEDDCNCFFKETNGKELLNELEKLKLIIKVDKNNSFDSDDYNVVKDFYITKLGVKLTTSKKIKQRSKSYCAKIIEEIKIRAIEINNLESCPQYIKEIRVYGSYLYKNEDELLNDLDLIMIVSTKESDFNGTKHFDFCKEHNLYCDGRIGWQHDAVIKYIYKRIKNGNSFLHILQEWEKNIKYETIFKDNRLESDGKN